MKTISRGPDRAPFYIANTLDMNVTDIIDAISPEIVARGCFLVEAVVGKDNDILITIESEKGNVTLEDCESVNDAMLAAFDRDVEDYSLTVSSAGLDQPFKVLRQYQKAIGSKVEVALKGGRKLLAELRAADEEGIELHYSARESVEGSRKKQLVEHDERFAYPEVNSVRPYISFE